MNLALGAMGSLLPKLGELLKEEYKMQTGVKRDVQAFSAELVSMRAALRRVAEVPRDQLDEEVRIWAGDVRELSYDTEDVVDSLLVRVKGSETDADMDGFKELVSKMKGLFKKGKARRQIATAIKDIKEQVQDVAARHERYKADGVFANLAAATRITAVDPLLVALHEDKQRIVGIETARDKLIEKLCLTDDASKQPKILSIVGFGGLGKTTLAKAIYDEVRSGFDCTAFVSVSRSPDIKKVLKEILFEVDRKRYMSLRGATLNEKQLIEQLQESLGTKRYFIVVDDIWDVTAWKTIRYALMGTECGSRIITTTRNINVSKECSSYNDDMVHNMEPLSNGDSQRLFYKRIFPGDNMCPPELQEVSMNILKKCAGVPLAIITIASHLASNQQIKPSSQWYVLLNSIGSGLTKGDTNFDEMKRILSFSYYDLPSHLKTCLLYLSTFPEDYIIDRDRLIRRWIAEGFIQGGIHSCRVHDIMLDLICDLASEENFVTIMDTIKLNTPLERKVRRLSIQKAELPTTQLATGSISQVRSFTIFRPVIIQMLPLSRFEVLRVLDLQDCNLEECGHLSLSCVGNLLYLRYLGLRNTRLRKIPLDIGKLLFLQTLDLKGVDGNAEELPGSFVRLRNLMFLYLGCITYLPAGHKSLTSLRELRGAYFTQDSDLEELRYLTELRELKFRLPSKYPLEKVHIMLESLGKLHKLESLHIASEATWVRIFVVLSMALSRLLGDSVWSPTRGPVHGGISSIRVHGGPGARDVPLHASRDSSPLPLASSRFHFHFHSHELTADS
ncbi:disease resistance protein RGA5-like [Lolium rigidum]|uniref:disease resistance protein RGA5-like n=1 Tax=Lolium rigidum TaxID=89674 RepID=UPI001F5C4D4D|nr:disease resistance protein RGA5-like [Lolium rigidum]